MSAPAHPSFSHGPSKPRNTHPTLFSPFAQIPLLNDSAHRFSVNLAFELCRTDALETVLSKPFTPSERAARPWARQLIAAISHLHACNIVHLDLKLENLLIDYYGDLKVCDLGLAVVLAPGEKTGRMCGSGVYAAPEVLLTHTFGRYDGRFADVWSMGICIFIINRGRFPFKVDHPTRLYKAFIEARDAAVHAGRKQPFPPFVLCTKSQRGSFSPSLRGLLDACLAIDPAARPSPSTLAQCPWLYETDDPHTAQTQVRVTGQQVEAMKHVVPRAQRRTVPLREDTTPDNSPTIQPRSIPSPNPPKLIPIAPSEPIDLKFRSNPGPSKTKPAFQRVRNAGKKTPYTRLQPSDSKRA